MKRQPSSTAAPRGNPPGSVALPADDRGGVVPAEIAVPDRDFVAVVDDVSDNESEIIRLLRRGKVGAAHIRLHKGVYWEVDLHYPGGLRAGRHRWYRRSVTAAYRLAIQKTQEQKTHGQLANALSTTERWMAVEALKICTRLGVELIDVVREFEKTHPHGANARTLDQLRVELTAAKTRKGCSERHVAALDYRLRSLIEGIGDQPITAITTAELQKEIGRHPNWNPTTISTVVQGWKIALNYAVRCGYAVKNPADRLELPRKVRAEPRILTLDQAKKLMAATLFEDRNSMLPHCRAYLAIGMFAGIRPEEMVRLDWEHVDLAAGAITILGANSKVRARRIVDISPNLAEWLRPVARPSGPVLEYPIEELRAAARGVLEWSEWPADILRHTFGSYFYAFHRNEALVKNQMGHSDDGRMFFHHYRVLIARPIAVIFWAIRPPVALLPLSGWDLHVPALVLGVSRRPLRARVKRRKPRRSSRRR